MESESTLAAGDGEALPGNALTGAQGAAQELTEDPGAATVAANPNPAPLEPLELPEPPPPTADHGLLAWFENFVRTDPELTRNTAAWNEIGASMARIRAAIASAKGVK